MLLMCGVRKLNKERGKKIMLLSEYLKNQYGVICDIYEKYDKLKADVPALKSREQIVKAITSNTPYGKEDVEVILRIKENKLPEIFGKFSKIFDPYYEDFINRKLSDKSHTVIITKLVLEFDVSPSYISYLIKFYINKKAMNHEEVTNVQNSLEEPVEKDVPGATESVLCEQSTSSQENVSRVISEESTLERFKDFCPNGQLSASLQQYYGDSSVTSNPTPTIHESIDAGRTPFTVETLMADICEGDACKCCKLSENWLDRLINKVKALFKK